MDRWLKWDEADREALLTLAVDLKIGENHLRDFMDWLEEIALRDGTAIRRVLSSESVGSLSTAPRLSRGDKLKRIKDEIRRLRFPRLSFIEDEIRRNIHALKLPPQIAIAIPPGLEGGSLTVNVKTSSREELQLLVGKLMEAAAGDAVDRIFDLLAGADGKTAAGAKPDKDRRKL